MAQTIKLKRSATQGAAPTTSNLELGEVAINTYDGKMYIKKNVGGTESIVQIGGSGSVSYLEAGMIEYEYTASSNQTTFSGSDSNSATLSYTANSIMVFLNGVLQDDGVDYTATNGTSVVFSSALTANDEVRIVAFTNVTNTSTLNNPTKLDAITTVNNQAAYSLTLNSSAYAPSSQNALIVSLNGITQEPGDSFTISGSTITFSPALVTGDVVDYIVDMGRTVTIGEYDSDLVVTGDITPGADSTYDLGASGTEWANVYADTFTGNLTGNVTGTVSSLSNHDTDDLSEGSTNLYFTTSRVDSHLSGGTGVTYNAGEISIGQDVSTTATPTFGNITTTGYIAGPSTFTIDPAAVGDNTGTLVVAGNLQVDGTTTTINSTTMTVDDLNITLASGAANAAAANGAGITVDGASATLTYNSTPDAWSFNKNLGVGTASPDATLEIRKDNASGLGAVLSLTNSNPSGRTGNSVAIGLSAYAHTTIDSASYRGAIIKAETTATGNGHSIIFETSDTSLVPAERVRIDHDGNVGIGTESPDSLLHLSAGSAPKIIIEDGANPRQNYIGIDGSDNLVLAADEDNLGASSTIQFRVDATERVRIDSSGRLLIGTSSSRETSGGGRQLQVEGTNGVTSSASITRNQNSTTGPSLTLGKTRDGSVGGNTAVIDGDDLGSIYFAGADGTDLNTIGASILSQADGTPSSNVMPANLIFSTNQGGSGVTEAMRISSNGQLKIGGTTNSPANVRAVLFGTGNASLIYNTGHTGLHINNENAAAGIDNYGAGVSFGRFASNSDDQSAAIVPVQTTSDEDHMGIAFLTHDTNTRANPLKEKMRITGAGSVGIGTTDPISKLDVRSGYIVAGSAGSTSGSKILSGYYNTDGDEAVTIGTSRSSAALVLGYGCYPSSSTADAFLSSADNVAWDRGAVSISDRFVFRNANSTTTTVGSSVTLTERFRIAENGYVGINTDNPQHFLDIGSGSASAPTHKGHIRLGGGALTNSGHGGIEFRGSTFGSGYGWRIQNEDPGGQTPLVISSRENSATWTEVARFRGSAVGGGIAFNGDTTAQNALDDYEEGTFTAHVKDTNDNVTYITSTATSRYVKIGSIVTAFIVVYAQGASAHTFVGTPYIEMPYTPGNNAGSYTAVNPYYLVGMGSIVSGYLFNTNGNKLYLATSDTTPFSSSASGFAMSSGNKRFYATITYAV